MIYYFFNIVINTLHLAHMHTNIIWHVVLWLLHSLSLTKAAIIKPVARTDYIWCHKCCLSTNVLQVWNIVTVNKLYNGREYMSTIYLSICSFNYEQFKTIWQCVYLIKKYITRTIIHADYAVATILIIITKRLFIIFTFYNLIADEQFKMCLVQKLCTK